MLTLRGRLRICLLAGVYLASAYLLSEDAVADIETLPVALTVIPGSDIFDPRDRQGIDPLETFRSGFKAGYEEGMAAGLRHCHGGKYVMPTLNSGVKERDLAAGYDRGFETGFGNALGRCVAQ